MRLYDKHKMGSLYPRGTVGNGSLIRIEAYNRFKIEICP